MPPLNGLTISSDEQPFEKVFAKDNIFVIPFFQRPYKWKPAKLAGFETDVSVTADDVENLHFMGAIILHERPTNAADANLLEVIDGQQRLTTVYLYIAAGIAVLARNGLHEEAGRRFKKFLVNVDEVAAPSNLCLHPAAADRQALNEVISELLGIAPLANELSGFNFKPLAHPQLNNSDRIRTNFAIAKRFFRNQIDEGGVDRVQRTLDAILSQMTVVFIGVKDPISGPKIFDSLNARQEPMTVGDLVKNDIFSRTGAAADLVTLNKINEHVWAPFYEPFGAPKDHLFDDYFFPYGLIHDPNVKKSDVYVSLREMWRRDGRTTEQVIEALSRYRDEYLDLQTGENRCGLGKQDALAYHRFFEMRAPVAAYPFLMQLCRSLRDSEISSEAFQESVAAIDSLLVRRAVCAIEPTGLKAVFQSMWRGPASATAPAIKDEFARHTTQNWPTDSDFATMMKTRRLAGARVTKYLLMEFDRSLGGDDPSYEFWIEHVLPQSPGGSWEQFSEEDRRAMTDTFANLVPLSSQMNQALQNSGYEVKQSVYQADSRYKSARDLANRFESWSPVEVSKRAEQMADWALQRWPYGPPD